MVREWINTPMDKYTSFSGNNPFASQAKMMFHLDRVMEWQQTGDTTPIFMEVNLTNKCNLACKWCINENFRGNEELSQFVVTRLISDFKQMGGKAVTFSGGGEPTEHPSFAVMAITAYALGVDLGLMTNGAFSDEKREYIGSLFQWARFSIDTLDVDHYKAWKGVNRLPQVLANIDGLQGKKVRIGANVNVSSEHTVKEVEELIFQLYNKVAYIQFRPVLPRYFKKEKIHVNKKVWSFLTKQYENDDRISFSSDKLDDLVNGNSFPFKVCEGHVFNPIVNANGDVCVCMYHPNDDRFVFGNLYKNTFQEIWSSLKRMQVKATLANLDYEKECQVCCKLTELNKFCEFIKHPEDMRDVNFL